MPTARILRLGSTGADVTAVQDLLRARGHDPGRSDGAFGPRTDAAVRAFQASRGLAVDGIVGPQTRAELADDDVVPRAERRIVPKTQTPLSEVGLVNVLAWGHELAFGAPPSRKRLAVAWAHVALENGRGREVYNNNFGNIAGFRWPGSVYMIRVQERVSRGPDVWRDVDMLFRSYGAPQVGAADYWAVLAKTYGDALPLFDAGRPYDAGMTLGELTWFTARAEPYARAMALLYAQCPG